MMAKARRAAAGFFAIWALGLASAAAQEDAALGAGADTWTFTFTGSLVYLDRGNNDALILQDTVTLDPLLSGSDVSPGFRPGADIRLGIGNSVFGVEGRFFGGFSWKERASLETSPIWNFPTVPPIFGLGVAQIDALQASRLNSYEANAVWHATRRVTVLGGVRLIDFEDRVELAADFGGNVATIDWNDDARGVGPQAGVRVRLIETDRLIVPIFVDLEGTAAAVRFDHDMTFAVEQAIGPAFGSESSHQEWSFVGEIGAALGIRLSRGARARVGYQAIYIDRAPSSSSMLTGVDVLNGTIAPASESFWAHGVNVGITLEY